MGLIAQWIVIALALLASCGWLLRGWLPVWRSPGALGSGCTAPEKAVPSACSACRGCEIGRQRAS
jgi:hypothetical protein